jgi:rod shape determining protein RodA
MGTSMIKQIWKRFLQPLDLWLVFFVSLVIGVSLILLYSASNTDGSRVLAKFYAFLFAFGVMWLIANIPQQVLMRFALPFYAVSVALLVAVELFGVISHGAQRWLNLGFGRIQPSELSKIALPLMLAWYFHLHEATLRWQNFVVATVIILIPMGLILKQPDLGTALLVASSGFFVLFFAGLSWRILALLTAAGSVLAYVLLHWNLCINVLHEYQCRRIATMLDPMSDPLGAGYHIIQGTIAIGSGGILGKGWLSGTQTHLDFIPERTTDFIFAVYGEEFGLIGNLILLVLYLLVIGRGLQIASRASTVFGRLLAGAVTLVFFTYAFVNMGMVSGILPVVGVPLPLVSYGGTSLVSLFAGFGLLMGVNKDRKLMKS